MNNKKYILGWLLAIGQLANIAFCEKDKSDRNNLEKIILPVNQGASLQNYLENLAGSKKSPEKHERKADPFAEEDRNLLQAFSDPDPWDD